MKDLRTKTHPGEGVMKQEKFLNTRKPSHPWACREFWNLREQHNWEEKTKPTEYEPNRVHHQQLGVGQGSAGCIIIRVKQLM